MNLLITSISAIFLWFLLKTIIIPKLKSANFSNNKLGEFSKIGWMAALSYFRKLTFITAVTYFLIWVLLKGLKLYTYFFKNSADVLDSVLGILIKTERLLESIDHKKFYFILIVLCIVIVALIVRNAKLYGKSIYIALLEKYQRGELSYLAPSINMDKIDEGIMWAEEEYNKISAINPNTLNSAYQEKRETYLEHLKNIIGTLNNQWEEENIKRRIIPTIEGNTGNDSEKKSFKDKVILFFSSTGLINSLYRTSLTISSLGLVFILLSFVAASNKIISSDTNSTAIQVAELHLQTKQNEYDKEWKKITNQNTSNEKVETENWNEEDEETVNQISIIFEREIAKTLAQSVKSNFYSKTAFNIRAGTVREKIIKTYTSKANGDTKRGYKVFEQKTTNKGPKAKYAEKYRNTYKKNINTKEPTSSIGKEFKKEFKKNVKSNKAVINQLKAKIANYKKTFNQPASIRQVAGLVLGESYQEFTGELGRMLQSQNIEAELSQNMVKRVGNQTVKNWINTQAKQFPVNLVNKTVEEAVENISVPKSKTDHFMKYAVKDLDFPTLNNINKKLSPLHQPSFTYNQLSSTQINKSKQAVEKIAGSNVKRGVRMAESLASFNYHFPAQVGTELGSAASEVIKKMSKSPTSFLFTEKTNLVSRRSTIRARSFKALKGFRRIGGVLIGQEATNSGTTNVSFTDIIWKPKGEKIEISLQRADGKIISAGVYSKDIIQQALSYVADGRPIAVTMVQAAPIPFYKILVHPSLVNTNLGCKAIGLDRLVDKYANSESHYQIKKAINIYKYQELLYNYVCYKIVSKRNKSLLINPYEIIMLEFDLQMKWQSFYTVLSGGKVLTDAKQSHLINKPKYFNQKIVKEIAAAIKKSRRNFSNFKKSIEEIDVHAFPENLFLCGTELWSGVKELPFSVDKELSFLKPSSKKNAAMFPLSFVRKVIYIPKKEEESNDTESLTVHDPWEFPALKATNIIEQKVWNGIRNNYSDLLVLKRMKSFTILQRLFRVALHGDLGTSFPVEKLASLANETQNSVKELLTPTWNSGGFTWKEWEGILAKEYSAEVIENLKQLWFAQEINAKKNRFPCN